MSNVLKNYNLTFTEVEIFQKRFKRCVSKDNNIQITLCTFLAEWSRDIHIGYINELLNDINSLKSGQTSPIETGSEAVIIDVYIVDTEFYDALTLETNITTPDYVMPTIDFEEILIEWKAFLEKPL